VIINSAIRLADLLMRVTDKPLYYLRGSWQTGEQCHRSRTTVPSSSVAVTSFSPCHFANFWVRSRVTPLHKSIHPWFSCKWN